MGPHHTHNMSKIDASQGPALDISSKGVQSWHSTPNPTEIQHIPTHISTTPIGVGMMQTNRPASGELASDPIIQHDSVELEYTSNMTPMPCQDMIFFKLFI